MAERRKSVATGRASVKDPPKSTTPKKGLSKADLREIDGMPAFLLRRLWPKKDGATKRNG